MARRQTEVLYNCIDAGKCRSGIWGGDFRPGVVRFSCLGITFWLMSEIIEIQSVKEDARGATHIMQYKEHLPFIAKRVFFITNVPEGVKRGFHAHRIEQHGCLCMQGSCRFELDDGHSRQEYILEMPDKLLYIPAMVWIEMSDFSSDCILLVFSDCIYDPEEKITDYEQFMLLVGENASRK